MSGNEDSDDDLLLNTNTFSKSQLRQQEKKKIKNNNFLDQYLDEESKRCEMKIKADQMISETDEKYWSRVQNAVTSEIDDINNDENKDDDNIFGTGTGDDANKDSSRLCLVLGVRNMFYPLKKNPRFKSIQLFSSEKEALSKLSTLRSVLAKKIYSKKTNISTFLYSKAIVKATTTSTANAVIISRDIVDWLWSVSCSGGSIGTFLTEGGTKTIIDLIQLEKCNSFTYPMEELHLGLNTLFGLVPEDEVQHETTASKDDDKEKIEEVRTEGLANFLKLWCMLFEKQLVSSCNKNSKRKKSYEDFVTLTCDCLVSLLRCNLDSCFHCGLDFMKILQQLIFSVLQFINEQLENRFNISSITWIQEVATKIITRIFTSIPHPQPNSDDADDPHSFIAFSLAIRNIPIFDTHGNTISLFCTKFKAQVFMVALEKCCYWKEEDVQLLQDECEELGLYNNNNKSVEPLSWQDCMIVSKKAYHDIECRINQHIRNGPRFYAAVCLANVCGDMGDTLFYQPLIHSTQHYTTATSSTTNNNSGVGDIMCSTMEALEDHCTTTKNKIKSVFTHPHLRRVKELLTWYATKYRHAKVDLGKKVGVKKQRTLDVWIENENGDDDDDDEKEEEKEKEKELEQMNEEKVEES